MNRYSYCLNNPLRYTDPSGYKKTPVKEDAFIMDYANYWNRRTLYGGGSGGGLNSFFSGGSGGPGGRNGTGLNGAYYDHSSSTYRSTGTGNPEVGWDYALSVAQNYASERWWRQDAYAGSSSEMAYKGSIWKYSSSFTSAENIGRNIGGDFLTSAKLASYLIATSLAVDEAKATLNFVDAFRNSPRTRLQNAFPGYFKGISNNVNNSLKALKVVKAVGRGLSRPFFFASVGFSTADVVMNPSLNNFAWNITDIGVGAGALLFAASPAGWIVGSGAAIYFTGRLAYDVYNIYNEGK